MDREHLIEITARRAAEAPGSTQLTPEDVDRVLEALFGTVEQPGTIAEALKADATVGLGSFGTFHSADGTAAFRPGKALSEYLRDQVG
jgi:DNA-binding protein HU-beta